MLESVRTARRYENLTAYRASSDYLARPRLAARADESDIHSHALTSIQRVKAHIGAYGRREHGAHTAQELNGTLNGIARACQARMIDPEVSLSGRIARMLDPLWWRRNLRREMLRENETTEHAAGGIRRKEQVYVSGHAVKRKAQRAKANRATLEALEVVNGAGEAVNLADVADASVSNPKLRRAELMTRCRGFEETAAFMGHVGLFLTLTCPSRFHRFDASGKPNKKWTDETPKDAQDYLCKVWARIRAAWNKAGHAPYGFRVAEPHHDGCPHWHILLFVAPDSVGWFEPSRMGRKDSGAGVVGMAARHAFKESPHEPGAAKHRFTSVLIDLKKGSATGYIAKYICKNIDGLKEGGEGMGLDFASGKKAIEASQRVRAWASTWGIRQFQQVGGPSVTVWRELRRLGTDLEQPLQNDLFEGPRAAADRALWALFWVLQGGPDVKRKDLTLKPAYVSDSEGKYGDEVERVWGVTAQEGDIDHHLQTRMHTWTVQRAGLNNINLHEAVRLDDRAVAAGALAWVKAAGFESVSDFHDRAAGAWTGVNNCRDEPEQDDATAEFDDATELWLDAQRGPGMTSQGWEGLPDHESHFQHDTEAKIDRATPNYRH